MKLKPQPGESKQDFFNRCLAAAETKDFSAFKGCAAAWDEAALADEEAGTRVTLAAEHIELAKGGEGEPGRFAMLAYTGALVARWWGDFIIDLSGLSLEHAKVPALREHNPHLAAGFIDGAEVTESGFLAQGQFISSTATGQEVQGLLAEGYPMQVSIGVMRLRVEQVEAGVKAEVNGRTVTGPCEIWRESQVYEISFVSLGADSATAAVPMGKNKEDDMGKEAMAAKAEQKQGGVQPQGAQLSEGGPVQPPAPVPAATVPAESAGLSAEEMERARAQALADERARTTAVLSTARKLGLSQEQGQEVLERGWNVERSALAMVDMAAEKNPPVASRGLEMGMDERDKVRLAAVDGLCMRHGMRVEKPAPGAREFMGMSLLFIARECLERAGVDTRHMSPSKLAKAALNPQRAALGLPSLSTSDLPNILRESANRVLVRAYEEAAVTWHLWARTISATDFRPINSIALSGVPELDQIPEGGEYKDFKLSESKLWYALKKYGKIFSYTWESLLNDDMGALTRIPVLFSSASARLVNSLAYAPIINNVTMADGVALFHSSHSNLATSAGAPSPATMKAARAAMRTQKDASGKVTLNLTPRYLFCPVALEHEAYVLLNSVALPESEKSSGVANPYGNGGPASVTPITDPILDSVSSTAWFLAAHHSQVDTVEIAFLDGQQSPELEEIENPSVDGITQKIRFVVGASCKDHRGLYKNAGA